MLRSGLLSETQAATLVSDLLPRKKFKKSCSIKLSEIMEAYSKEELVAEMGAAFLCGHVGIENTTIENSAAYLAGWLKALKNDKTLLVHAAAQAQRSTDYILNVTHTSEDWLVV